MGPMPLSEAAKLLRMPYECLKVLVRRGKIPSVIIEKGKREYKALDEETLNQLKSNECTGSYERLYQQWMDEQYSGLHTGKPMSKRGMEGNEYGLKRFWEVLEASSSILNLNPKNLRKVLGAF